MKRTIIAKLSCLLACAACVSSVQASVIIYEPFVFPDADTSLTGNPGGAGLSGNWSANSGYVENTGLTYGDLQTTGDSAIVNGGWRSAQVSVDTTTAGYSALLADGGELWFSLIMRVDVINNRAYFSLNNNGIGTSNNGDIVAGVGIGFGLASDETFYANVWDDLDNGNWGTNNLTAAPSGNGTTTTGTGDIGTYFIVGRVQWGATATDADTISLYLPGTDLALGSAVSTSSGVIADQSVLDLLSIQNLDDNNTTVDGNVFDEIRFGASYADVSPVNAIPEPGSVMLVCLGMLLPLRRRRG